MMVMDNGMHRSMELFSMVVVFLFSRMKAEEKLFYSTVAFCASSLMNIWLNVGVCMCTLP